MSQDQKPPPAEGSALWYKDAIIYEVHVRAFSDSNARRHRRLRRAHRQARLPRRTSASRRSGSCPSTPRRCATTATTSPTTPTSTRPTGRLRDFEPPPARGAPPRHPRHHRARPQPHLEPAPVVPARADRAARARAGATSTCGATRPTATRTPGSSSRTSRPRTGRWDPVANAYYWHRFYSTSPTSTSRTPTSTPPSSTSSTSGSRWASTGCGSTPCRTSTSAKARTARTCRRRTPSCRSSGATSTRTSPDRMLLAEANQWPEDAAAYFGERRRVPHELPLPAHAAHLHGGPARGPLPHHRHPRADAR